MQKIKELVLPPWKSLVRMTCIVFSHLHKIHHLLQVLGIRLRFLGTLQKFLKIACHMSTMSLTLYPLPATTISLTSYHYIPYQLPLHPLPAMYHCIPYQLPLHPLPATTSSLTSYHCIPYQLPLHPLPATTASLTSYHCIPYQLPLHPLPATTGSLTSYHSVPYRQQPQPLLTTTTTASSTLARSGYFRNRCTGTFSRSLRGNRCRDCSWQL